MAQLVSGDLAGAVYDQLHTNTNTKVHQRKFTQIHKKCQSKGWEMAQLVSGDLAGAVYD